MCNRFAMYAKPHQIANYFQVSVTQPIAKSYNIFPGDTVYVVRENANRGRELISAQWGLIPHWMLLRHPTARFSEARIETASEKPAYREPFKTRRCLIIASGFYIWSCSQLGRKQPYFFYPKQEGVLFAFAGLWDYWEDRYHDHREFVQSCVILTRPSEEPFNILHPRMPVVLGPHQFARWLDYSNSDVAGLNQFLAGPTAVPLNCRQVSRYVNEARHNSERCLV